MRASEDEEEDEDDVERGRARSCAVEECSNRRESAHDNASKSFPYFSLAMPRHRPYTS